MPTFYPDKFLDELPILDSVDGDTIICVASGMDYLSFRVAVSVLFTSPEFLGEPTAPTPDPADSSTRLATTEFVQDLLAGFTGGGSDIAINDPIIDGIVNRVLFTGPGLLLAHSPNMTFNGKSLVINSPGILNAPVMEASGGPSDSSVVGLRVRNNSYNSYLEFVVGVFPQINTFSSHRIVLQGIGTGGAAGPFTFNTGVDTTGTERFLLKTIDLASRGLVVEGALNQNAPLVVFRGRSSTTAGCDMGVIDTKWANNVHNTRRAKLIFKVSDASGMDKVGMEIESVGARAVVTVGDTNNIGLLKINHGGSGQGDSGIHLFANASLYPVVLQVLDSALLVTNETGALSPVMCAGIRSQYNTSILRMADNYWWLDPVSVFDNRARLSIGVTAPDYMQFFVAALFATNTGIGIRLHPSQSADAFQVLNYDHTTKLAWIDKDGRYHGDGSQLTGIVSSGLTSARPVSSVVGTMFFDTTLNKPIWWNGSTWVDSVGTTV